MKVVGKGMHHHTGYFGLKDKFSYPVDVRLVLDDNSAKRDH